MHSRLLPDARFWLGITLLQSVQGEEGLRMLEGVAAAVPKSPFIQGQPGWAYGRAGKANQAREAWWVECCGLAAGAAMSKMER